MGLALQVQQVLGRDPHAGDLYMLGDLDGHEGRQLRGSRYADNPKPASGAPHASPSCDHEQRGSVPEPNLSAQPQTLSTRDTGATNSHATGCRQAALPLPHMNDPGLDGRGNDVGVRRYIRVADSRSAC
jgi:hypothetical protein